MDRELLVFLVFAFFTFAYAFVTGLFSLMFGNFKLYSETSNKKHPGEDQFLASNQGLEPGIYMFPQIYRLDKADDDFKEKQFRGPNGQLIIMGKPLSLLVIYGVTYIIHITIFSMIFGIGYLFRIPEDQNALVAFLAVCISGSYHVLRAVEVNMFRIPVYSWAIILRGIVVTLLTAAFAMFVWTALGRIT